jgi:hypothetical protein
MRKVRRFGIRKHPRGTIVHVGLFYIIRISVVSTVCLAEKNSIFHVEAIAHANANIAYAEVARHFIVKLIGSQGQEYVTQQRHPGVSVQRSP